VHKTHALEAHSGTQNQKKAISSYLLAHFQAKEKTLSWTVTGDETWVHHFEPGTKRLCIEWQNPQSPQKKKFKVFISRQGHDHCLLEGVTPVDAMTKGQIDNSDTSGH
jgi:hypothetical protein